MSRRGRTGPTISLFAFQDIITSVTAIVIVVVLFLALELVQSKQAAHAESSAGVSEDLEERIQSLQSELAQIQSQTARLSAAVNDASALPPKELEAEIAAAKQSIEDLEARVSLLVEQNQQWKIKEKAALAREFDLQADRQRLSSLESEIEDIESEVEATRNDRRPVFGLPRGVTHGGWVVVIEENVISAAPLGRASPPLTFQPGGLSSLWSSPASGFLKWVTEEQQSQAYFLLLIKPGGARGFDEIEADFTTRQIAFGFDVIDQHQDILHPEKGAAP